MLVLAGKEKAGAEGRQDALAVELCTKLCEDLLKEGAFVDAKEDISGRTPLHIGMPSSPSHFQCYRQDRTYQLKHLWHILIGFRGNSDKSAANIIFLSPPLWCP